MGLILLCLSEEIEGNTILCTALLALHLLFPLLAQYHMSMDNIIILRDSVTPVFTLLCTVSINVLEFLPAFSISRYLLQSKHS